MNQILFSKNNEQEKKSKVKINSKQKIYKLQFLVSIVLFCYTIIFYFYNSQKRNSQENISKQIANNYNISRLYNNSENSGTSLFENNGKQFNIIGMIEIPKINIYYPIISESNDELLKISPCRISGPMPNENGNLCIAGHNYDNYKFFSKVSDLQKDDEIIIHNIDGFKLSYKIREIYEVLANDLSPLEASDNTKKQVTLVTCNNFNSNTRIIIKAFAN